MSDFDPAAFMEATFSETNSTVVVPLPIGEPIAEITDVKFDGGTSHKEGKPPRNWLRLDVTWEINDPNYLEIAKKSSAKLRYGVMLDLTDSGQISMEAGTNVKLGRLRAAVGLNEPGEPFNARMLVGRSAKIKVIQKTIEGREGIFNDVDGVAKLA